MMSLNGRTKSTYIQWQEVAILKSQTVCCKLVHVSVTVLHMFYVEAQKPEMSTFNMCICSLLQTECDSLMAEENPPKT